MRTPLLTNSLITCWNHRIDSDFFLCIENLHEYRKTSFTCVSQTLSLNLCSSCLVMVSALAMIGMMFTLLSSAFIVTRSRAFRLQRHNATTAVHLLLTLGEESHYTRSKNESWFQNSKDITGFVWHWSVQAMYQDSVRHMFLLYVSLAPSRHEQRSDTYECPVGAMK